MIKGENDVTHHGSVIYYGEKRVTKNELSHLFQKLDEEFMEERFVEHKNDSGGKSIKKIRGKMSQVIQWVLLPALHYCLLLHRHPFQSSSLSSSMFIIEGVQRLEYE